MSFVKRKITVTFQLGQGAFGESGTNTVTISGLRVQANIHKIGGADGGGGITALRIYGLTLGLMNQLSGMQYVTRMRKNTVIVQAGDDEAGMTTVFVGQVVVSMMDFSQSPAVTLNISATPGAFYLVAPAAPFSSPGSVDAAQILSSLASVMGLGFVNNGVSGKMLKTPYYAGSPMDQAAAVIRDAGIEWNGCHDRTLAIWPKGGNAPGNTVNLNAQTGLVGYPSYWENGIVFRALFNPAFSFGGLVKITNTPIKVSNQTWKCFDVVHTLESEMPGGAWFTDIKGVALNPPSS